MTGIVGTVFLSRLHEVRWANQRQAGLHAEVRRAKCGLQGTGAGSVRGVCTKIGRKQVGRVAGLHRALSLAPIVGEAILDYLKQGRPETTQRALFVGAYAPNKPLSRVAVSLRAKYYLRKAGITVSRPGSHTLRHSCVQRLVDSGFSLKTIGDFVGHRSPDCCAGVGMGLTRCRDCSTSPRISATSAPHRPPST